MRLKIRQMFEMQKSFFGVWRLALEIYFDEFKKVISIFFRTSPPEKIISVLIVQRCKVHNLTPTLYFTI
jgi:hypothetical protein